MRRILLQEGINPRPRAIHSNRPDFQPWGDFLKMHISALMVCDFFCKTIWTPLVRRQTFTLAFSTSTGGRDGLRVRRDDM